MIKTILFYILFFFSVLTADAQNSRLVASCCEEKKEEMGRCTGNAYCNACSNCSRCADCSSGGSCGVCASYSAPVRYTAPRSYNRSSGVSKGTSKASLKASSKNSLHIAPKKEPVAVKVKAVYHSEDMLATSSDNVKLLEEPGNEYGVIEVLRKYAVLKVIAIDEEWLQVVVIESKNFGYVNAKFVYKI